MMTKEPKPEIPFPSDQGALSSVIVGLIQTNLAFGRGKGKSLCVCDEGSPEIFGYQPLVCLKTDGAEAHFANNRTVKPASF